MLLTKRALWRIAAVAILYFLLGGGCVAVGILFLFLEIDAVPLFILGAIAWAMCPLSVLWGRYAEGKGKLIHTGNRLVRNELKPREFIRQYEACRRDPTLAVCKPDVDTLNLVFVAYDTLNDREGCLSTMDEMLCVSSEKRRVTVELLKVSYLFSQGEKEEAEVLFSSLRTQRLDAMSNLLADNILKSDRASAMGDYKTAEAHYLKLLSQTFPKLDPLGLLIVHCKLGETYERMGARATAMEHYRYCVENCGETAIGVSARAALERMEDVK